MGTASLCLTAAIALLAVVDLGIALLPLVTPGHKGGKDRDKYGFRSHAKRSALCRSVCFACVVSLAIALVLAHGELSGRRGRNIMGETVQPFSLAGLFVFNLVMNMMMMYNSCFGRRSAHRLKCNILLPVTGGGYDIKQGSPTSCAASPLSTTPSPQLEKTVEHYTSHLCIKVHAGGVKPDEEDCVMDDRHLDRRDSDCMLRGSGGHKREKGAQMRVETPPISQYDEELLDALMHDTIKVLVDG